MLIIRDLVEVRSQPTVVRLDHLNDTNNNWISENYYITTEVGNHFKTLDYLLSREEGQGVFLIGHYGSGKSHFLAYLAQAVEAGKMGNGKTTVLPVSLLNYSADKSLEAIITHALSLSNDTDRRGQWQALANKHPGGLLLILDELSEFLRSKPNMRSFNEDIRYLQFMGEWSSEHPLWIVAALQEKIEHTGEMEYDLFRKIKDRYPMRMILSPTHVKDLIGERILLKKEGYEEAVGKLVKQLKRAFPENPMDYHQFGSIYPLHPTTLALLEEVRDRFSQARGIVGFTITQLGGDAARDIPPFLDKSWGALLSPDAIVDHFRDLFEVQPEFLPLAQKVLPYYRNHKERLFKKEAQQILADRILKLLLLVHLSPTREALTVKEASWWLLYKVSTIDPGKNETVIKRILDLMTNEGAFVKKQGDAYFLDLAEDGRETLDHLLSRTCAELENKGQTLLESLIPLLDKNQFNPFTLDRDRWQKHGLTWFFHERILQVYLGGGAVELKNGPGLQIGLPWGKAPAGRNCYQLHPKPLEVTSELVELAALLQLKERPLARQVLDKIEERIQMRRPIFAASLKGSYQQARLLDDKGAEVRHQGVIVDGGMKQLVGRLGDLIFRRLWPRFEAFAPSYGALPKEAYRQLMAFSLNHDLDHQDAPDMVRTIREAYLVPMKLLERKGRSYRTSPRLDHHELITAIKDMLTHKTSPKRFYEHLATPVYGLVPDQVHLLLIFLMIQGEIDILKGRNSYRDLYESFPTPEAYDIIVPGKALNVNQLQDLTRLCQGLDVPPPKEANVLAQRRCASQLKRLGRKCRDELSAFLSRIGDSTDLGDLHKKVTRHLEQWAALEKGENEIQGVQHFLFEIGSPGRFLEIHGELTTLPRKLESLLNERRRMLHLLSHPSISACPNESIRLATEHLGEPPNLAETDVLEEWISAARRIHEQFKGWYGERHNQFWSKLNRHEVFAYEVPAIAHGRHLGLSQTIERFKRERGQVQSSICHGLGNLDFQPVCLCSFNGDTAPVANMMKILIESRDEIEDTVTRFFGQDRVKDKVREWMDTGVESHPKTHAYLSGEEAYPRIGNLNLFDQHLSGLELFRKVPAEKVVNLLCERTWETGHLKTQLNRLLDGLGPRLSFEQGEAPAEPARPDLAAWCLEMSLRTGKPLPPGLSKAETADFPQLVRPEWVGESCLDHLEELGLGEAVENEILRMVLDGRLQAPGAYGDGPLAALGSLVQPPVIKNARHLAQVTANLYQQHDRMLKLEGKRWLKMLNQLAEVDLPHIPSLFTLLEEFENWQWLIIDCLGVPLLPLFEEALSELLPHWKMVELAFGLVPTPTHTANFFDELARTGTNKTFVKRNCVDEVIHEAGGDFKRLQRRTLAELEIAAGSLKELDPGKNLLVFADHGFRLNPDGKGFGHGGNSTLERLVPLFRLESY